MLVRNCLSVVFIYIFLVGSMTKADENLFGYSSSSDTLPQDALEVYEWITYRSQKNTGTYEAFDYRTEIEYGWTDWLSQGVYLNFRQHKIADSAPLDDSGSPEYGNLNSGIRFQGIQTAFKFNVLSPYKDDLGLAFYVEPGYSQIFKITGEDQEEYSLELKALFQKNFFEHQMTTVLNINIEPEVRKFKSSVDWEREIAVEMTAGASYRFIPKWFGGAEARYHSEYPDYGKREHWAVFLGPNVHYGSLNWWFTFTVMPQFAGGPTPEGESIHLSEHEKTEYRLKIGYNF